MSKEIAAGPHELRQMFGARIRALRQERGVSQEALGDAAGLHRTFVGRVERGETNLTLENIGKLARALDVPLAEIFAPFIQDRGA